MLERWLEGCALSTMLSCPVGRRRSRGQIFRIGHMGKTTESDIEETIEALKAVLGS